MRRDPKGRVAPDGAATEHHPELFRLLVESVGDYAIFMLDPEGHVVSWNTGAERIKGYSAREIVGQHFSRFYPEEDVADGKPQRILQLALSQGRFEDRGVRLRKDGSPFFAHVTITPLRDERGELRGFAKVTRDLTEQARTEEQEAQLVALRRTEAHFVLLVDASSQLLVAAEVEATLHRIVRLSTRLIQADAYAIWVVDSERDEWRMTAHHGLSAEYAARQSVISGVGAPAPTEPMPVTDLESEPMLENRLEGYRREGIESILVMPLRTDEASRGTITFYYRQRHEFRPMEIRSASALANLAAAALHTAELRDHERVARQLLELANFRLRFLAEASILLSESLDYERTLQDLAQLAVPHLADWCAVHIRMDEGDIRSLAVAHTDAEKVEMARDLQQRYPVDANAPHGVARVLRTGQYELIPDITDDVLVEAARDDEHLTILRSVGVRSSLCVPLIARGRTIGALTLISTDRALGAVDVSLAQELARRAALAIDNAELYRAARREQARFASIIASLDYAVFQVDQNGRLEYFNPKAAELFDYRPSEMLWRGLHGLIHRKRPDGSPLPEEECRLLQSLSRGDPYAAQDVYVKRDGSFVDVEIHAAPIMIDGVVGGGVIACQDITERLRQERLKDEYLGFASHELRSPLTSVNGFARWLARRAKAEPEQYGEDAVDAIDTIESEARRMSGIVEAFLDLTRIQSGRLVVDPMYTDLTGLMRDEAAALPSRFDGVEVRPKLPSEPLMAWTDVERLRQVIRNLLDNAAKYGGQAGPIDIELKQDERSARIAVRDRGAGIPPEDQPHVFDRFFRSHTRRVTEKKGLGVGLYVVKRIVERLGGEISFESAPGEGTEFIVRLPLSGPPADE